MISSFLRDWGRDSIQLRCGVDQKEEIFFIPQVFLAGFDSEIRTVL
jgi:hypothetical protein